MATNFLTQLYKRYSESFVCKSLRQELFALVHGEQDLAKRLIDWEKRKHPNKSERWYLEKVIYDLRRRA